MRFDTTPGIKNTTPLPTIVVRKRKAGEMQLNTQRHQQSRRCFSLHKLSLDPIQTIVEAGGFLHWIPKSRRASPFSRF
jgi:hypothetical protein